MDFNIYTISAVGLVILALVYFLIKRNNRDQDKYERQENEGGIKPDKHDEPRI